MDQLIDFDSTLILECDLHDLEGICKTLYTNTNGSVSHVRLLCLRYWIVVHINDFIQVLGNSLGNIVKLFIIEFSCLSVYKASETNRSEVANSNFIRASILDDLSTEVRALNGTEVLLV